MLLLSCVLQQNSGWAISAVDTPEDGCSPLKLLILLCSLSLPDAPHHNYTDSVPFSVCSGCHLRDATHDPVVLQHKDVKSMLVATLRSLSFPLETLPQNNNNR